MKSTLSGAVGVAAIAFVCTAAASAANPQHGHCCGTTGTQSAQPADMHLFRALFDHRAEITRTVMPRSDGVETLTESGNPAVTEMLHAHVESMLARMKEARPIHQRDPLFREIFRNASKISVHQERTPKGIRVVETSSDAYVVKLIQAHAEVVTAFIANGRAEMMRNHAVPLREAVDVPW